MEAKEYQNLAMRTNDGKGTERLENGSEKKPEPNTKATS